MIGMEYNFTQIYADPGYCFANRSEDTIWYDVIWVTEEEQKSNTYHQITLERAKEIKDAYKKRFGITP